MSILRKCYLEIGKTIIIQHNFMKNNNGIKN